MVYHYSSVTWGYLCKSFILFVVITIFQETLSTTTTTTKTTTPTPSSTLPYTVVYERCLNIKQRPSALNTESVQKDFSRHHIIPHSVLKDFMSGLLEITMDPSNQLGQDYVKKYFTAIFTAQVNRIEPKKMNYIQTRAKDISTVKIIGNENLFRLYWTLLSWMPGNYFEGPADRYDDPKNNYELDGRYIVNNDNHFDEVGELSDRIDYFNRNDAGGRDKENMEKILQLLTKVANRGPYKYNENQWVSRSENGKKKWGIKVPTIKRSTVKPLTTSFTTNKPKSTTSSQKTLGEPKSKKHKASKEIEPYCDTEGIVESVETTLTSSQ